MWKTTPVTIFFLLALMPWLDPPGALSFVWDVSNASAILISALLGFLLQWSGALALGWDSNSHLLFVHWNISWGSIKHRDKRRLSRIWLTWVLVQCNFCNLSCSSWAVQNLCDTTGGLYTFQVRPRVCEHLWGCCSPLWDVSLHITQLEGVGGIFGQAKLAFLQTESQHGRPHLWEVRCKQQHTQCCLNQTHLLQMKVLRETVLVSPKSYVIVSMIFCLVYRIEWLISVLWLGIILSLGYDDWSIAVLVKH